MSWRLNLLEHLPRKNFLSWSQALLWGHREIQEHYTGINFCFVTSKSSSFSLAFHLLQDWFAKYWQAEFTLSPLGRDHGRGVLMSLVSRAGEMRHGLWQTLHNMVARVIATLILQLRTVAALLWCWQALHCTFRNVSGGCTIIFEGLKSGE